MWQSIEKREGFSDVRSACRQHVPDDLRYSTRILSRGYILKDAKDAAWL
jgi:hypothetical protein